MLGKQGWKLITNHDTILYKVFKAKYYPREGFLEAKLGHNPSYTWRSVHASQVIVRSGLRWRMGNGTKVHVWNQPWLRDDSNACITTTCVARKENMIVFELVNQNTSSWNQTVIRQLFNSRDIIEIMKIPLNLQHEEDMPIWKHSRHGTYSVRSAYYHLMEEIIYNDHLKVEGNWKKLWQLVVPTKVKLFLWRLLRGHLPIRSRIVQKGVQGNNKCPHCDSFEENEWHCFFRCASTQKVWKETED
ncbi:hypothetical protein QL285_015425 [Trifolium repens]|nr:hypothetical protein QL285_015425 [Trifolium repens]